MAQDKEIQILTSSWNLRPARRAAGLLSSPCRMRGAQAEDKEQQTPLIAAEPHGKLQAVMQQAARGEIDVDELA